MLKLCIHADIWYRNNKGFFHRFEEDFFTLFLNRPTAQLLLETHLNKTFGPSNWVYISQPWFEVIDSEAKQKTAQSANSERL